MKASHNFVFFPNAYTGKWEAVHRDYKDELWNGGEHKISSSSIETLVSLIDKFETVEKIRAFMDWWEENERISQEIFLTNIDRRLKEAEEEYDM